jgi:hypothetical protein
MRLEATDQGEGVRLEATDHLELSWLLQNQ